MKDVSKLKTLNFSENWTKFRIVAHGRTLGYGMEYTDKHFETIEVKPCFDRLGGYSVSYDGRIKYTKNAWELKKVLAESWQKYIEYAKF